MQITFSELKKFFTNPIGLAAVLINFLLAIWGLFEKGWNYSNFHLFHEPLPIQILTLTNYFAISLAEMISKAFFQPEHSDFGYAIISEFEMFLIVIFTILQWLIIGYICSLLVRRIKEG